MTTDPMPDPRSLEPAELHRSAEQLLSIAPDPVTLVADLLRDIRQNLRTEKAIQVGHDHTRMIFRDDVERSYVNGMRAALDDLRAMRPATNTQLSYEGARGQAVRRLRASIRWHDSQLKEL